MSKFDVNAELNISKKGLSCQEVAKALQQLGITCQISENISVQKEPNTNQLNLENGCSIDLCGLNRDKYQQVWFHLRDKFNLGCANLKIDGQYTGCIYSYLQESACPGFKPKTS